jgi:hypothetical protein
MIFRDLIQPEEFYDGQLVWFNISKTTNKISILHTSMTIQYIGINQIHMTMVGYVVCKVVIRKLSETYYFTKI